MRRLCKSLQNHWPSLLLLALAACASPLPAPEPEESPFTSLTREMFSSVLHEIDENYIERTDLGALTLAGLEAIGELDPALALTVEIGPTKEAIRIAINGEAVAAAPITPPLNTIAWAESAAEVLTKLRNQDPLFAQASPEVLYDAAFDAMVGLLDRYSRYAGEDEAKTNRDARDGFGGVGVAVGEHPTGARVRTVAEGKPAQAAGVHVDDIIQAIDGRSLTGTPLRQINRMLRGPVSKPVTLTLKRDGLADPFVVTVGRTRIVPDTVFASPRGDTLLIRITSFNDLTAEAVNDVVKESLSNGDASSPKGVILDLRGNPGGLLNRAIDVADLFLESGEVSSTDGRNSRSFQEFFADKGDITDGRPVAVLVDGATASAAEVLAAALQDNGRAVIIGASTFGKGSVQTVFELPNEGELILTWARLVTPSGYALHETGVMPVICTQSLTPISVLLHHTLIRDPATTLHNLSLRRRIGAKDVAARAHAATLCPWRPVGLPSGRDEEAALQLLRNPALYESAIALSLPPTP